MFIAVLVCALLGGLLAAVATPIAKLVTRGFEPARAKKVTGVFMGGVAGLTAGFGPVVARSRVGEELEVLLTIKRRSEVTLSHALAPLLENPQVREALKGMSAAEAQGYTAKLTSEGIAMLDADKLELWAGIRGRMADASPKLCATMWNGGMTPRLILEALDALPQPDQQQWGEIAAQAGLLRLSHPEPQPAPLISLRDGIAEVVALLPANEGATFMADAAKTPLPDPRACELAKLLFTTAKQLGPEHRAAFYRGLAAGR